MRLLADENIENEMIIGLRLAGFEVDSIRENTPGIEDGSVLDIANKTSSILLTSDKDFGELIYRDHQASNGVILLRFGDLPMQERIDRLKILLQDQRNSLVGAFCVVSSQGMRFRKAG